MSLLKQFHKRMLINYISGSMIAVFGVGSVFIFHTLTLSGSEVLVLLGIMVISGSVMISLELWMYLRDIRPLKQFFFAGERPQEAFIRAHSFPLLTVRRILGPHLFGLSIPATGLALTAIYTEHLSLPYVYVGYAWMGALLIAALHAMIEYFLTSRAIQPLIGPIMQASATKLKLDGAALMSMKWKLLLSMLLIALFPIALFLLAGQIRETATGTAAYWNWASLIIFVILFLSIAGAIVLYRNMEQPIVELRHNLEQVQQGQFEEMENYYSDEFATLTDGFNAMVQGIKARDAENERLLESFFTVFAATLDARDSYTAGHTSRVADYSTQIAIRAGLTGDHLDLLRKSALLHDIGKIGIPDAVLLKDGRLTDEEFATIKKHPVIGAMILEKVNLPEHLVPLLDGVRHHHERFDGNGYPDGLSGSAIPEFGRIIAVADAFDAMTSNRPYRDAMPYAKARDILINGRGTQWDAAYVDQFLDFYEERFGKTRDQKSSLNG
ncbi:HD-GYP domain-containing protein [Salisediminibacterium beveridgei]|uniref:Cyclic di-GMP phosphodiesterase response regulator RpfG n=1 Tax=Salisediminibacterium beveridgei TaxID=632773 RepID=A0A1D7QYH6_9BACI|nr:HD-GYP domain-containing protein [Salisediminibacterium beveridgei]AOM84049.1 Cyclic di-GMP phosphodiesterase response regulator RpfG [Salisediminibacterium beveridgei]